MSEPPTGTEVDAIRVCPGGAQVEGIDVSAYQGGSIDWAAVHASGREFAIARAAEGLTRDGTFARNWSEMQRVGMVRGAYQFFHPNLDPNAQADLIVSMVGHLGPGDLPVMADVEVSGGESGGTIAARLQTWLDRVQAGTGKEPIIYTGAWFWDPQVGSTAFGRYGLVDSYYSTSCPNLALGWSSFKIWQYTDGTCSGCPSVGPVPSIGQSCDRDRFNGSLDDLRAFANACVASPEVCDGRDNDCDGVVDNGEVCEHDEILANRVVIDQASTTDVDGDHRADACGRGVAGFWCHLATDDGFGTAQPTLTDVSDDRGWGDITNYATFRMGDVDGDGRADVCARSDTTFDCWASSAGGVGFGAAIVGPDLSDANGWNNIQFYSTIRLLDYTGDGKDDLCARGVDGLFCWPSTATGFGDMTTPLPWSDAHGFNSAKYYGTLRTGDVNGDGKIDACIRTSAGIECYLSDGAALATRIDGPPLSDDEGWGAMQYWSTIRLADVNGDHRADLCGRGVDGLFCWMSTGMGFETMPVNIPDLSDARGWTDPANYTTLRMGDVNADGAMDVCARGDAGMFCWLWTGAGFGPSVAGPTLDDPNGWSNATYYRTIQLADVNGDRRADICARGVDGLFCWRSTGTGFEAMPVHLDEFTDMGGWSAPQYGTTLRVAGPRCTPTAEVCNGRDDDCDGMVDEGCGGDGGVVGGDGGVVGNDGGSVVGNDGGGVVGNDGGVVGSDGGGRRDGGTTTGMDGGCGCSTAGHAPRAAHGLLGIALGLMAVRRRRRAG